MIVAANLLAAGDSGLLSSFLPIVLGVLGLAGACATAVGGYFGLKAARHKAGDQDKALTNLIDALAAAEREKDELRDRVSKQAAHIELADKQLVNAQEESKSLRERIYYLERQEEKWQSKVEQLEDRWQERLTRLERRSRAEEDPGPTEALPQ